MNGAHEAGGGARYLRTLLIVVGVVGAVVLSGYLAGRITGRPGAGPKAQATPKTPATTGPPARPAAQRFAPPRQPITGPNRPPLPAERGGPFGSRRTTGTSTVALTFDDGPDPKHTPQTLELLRRYRIKATFCLVGVNAKAFPRLVKAIVDDGHTLCNHSWDHDIQLGTKSRATIRANLIRANNAIRAAAPGSRISYYRQPGGAWTAGVVGVARELGMTSLHWTVDPQDWRKPSAGSIAGTVNAGTTRGAIVLLHDAGGDRRGTVTALRSILPNLSRRFQLGALPPGTDAPRRHGFELPVKPGQI
ncbi:polysaccharide deacetylase family protein [Phytohabitans aurantiacus]|uniref:polysaccharide deacetylase family protein n=1 Tax=Phytohabitans aurantiacus TaxID=3016789 RepID=UPI002491727C|nr:polysaccharide deacetylase family protein [Phytohabitans aurantiacus]